jgi:hypothetical protein
MKKVDFHELIKQAEANRSKANLVGVSKPDPGLPVSLADRPIDNLPSVPVVQEDPEVVEEYTWVPFKPNKRKCRPEDHWPRTGCCEKCGDIFPCPSGNCGHVDCADPSLIGFNCKGNGTALPEFLNVIPGGENLVARAECGTLEIREESAD